MILKILNPHLFHLFSVFLAQNSHPTFKIPLARGLAAGVLSMSSVVAIAARESSVSPQRLPCTWFFL